MQDCAALICKPGHEAAHTSHRREILDNPVILLILSKPADEHSLMMLMPPDYRSAQRGYLAGVANFTVTSG